MTSSPSGAANRFPCRLRFWALAVTLACVVGVGVPLPVAAAPGESTHHGPADAVIALVDTGINPYHAEFRDHSPRALQHPSTYLPGFPEDAVALHLTLDGETDYHEAVHADCERVWSKIQPDTLYWFPGTKIVGAITFAKTSVDCSSYKADFGNIMGSVLDGHGHGTMVASRAAANTFGGCPDCRVVAVQGLADGVSWAASNADWIDIQSNSWGTFVPAWAPTSEVGLLASHPEFVRTIEDAAQRHLAFWGAGNGALFFYGVVGHPTLVVPHMTPSVLIVGGHDNGYVTAWPGFSPHVVADACSSWAADHESLDFTADHLGGGTSAATPFSAGMAGRMLIHARSLVGDGRTGVRDGVVALGDADGIDTGPLSDGQLTMAELREVLLTTASPRPRGQFEDGAVCDVDWALGFDHPIPPRLARTSTPVRWQDVPEGYPEFVQIGYGAVDSDAYQRAANVLAGLASMPDRSTTDAYFRGDHTVRSALHSVFAGDYGR